MKFIITAFSLFTLTFCKSYCQNKNQIGIDFQLENGSKGKNITYNPLEVTDPFRPSFKANSNFEFGLSYERLLSKKSSIGIELKSRVALYQYIFTFPAGSNFLTEMIIFGKESFLSIPILYKYRTGIINISLGPTFENFLGYKETASVFFDPVTQSYLPKDFFPNKWSFGVLGKISKSIKIYKKLLIEPAIFYNPILSFKKNYSGLSAIVKYTF